MPPPRNATGKRFVLEKRGINGRQVSTQPALRHSSPRSALWPARAERAASFSPPPAARSGRTRPADPRGLSETSVRSGTPQPALGSRGPQGRARGLPLPTRGGNRARMLRRSARAVRRIGPLRHSTARARLARATGPSARPPSPHPRREAGAHVPPIRAGGPTHRSAPALHSPRSALHSPRSARAGYRAERAASFSPPAAGTGRTRPADPRGLSETSVRSGTPQPALSSRGLQGGCLSSYRPSSPCLAAAAAAAARRRRQSSVATRPRGVRSR
jgi:hypothetical protein